MSETMNECVKGVLWIDEAQEPSLLVGGLNQLQRHILALQEAGVDEVLITGSYTSECLKVCLATPRRKIPI
ncbi:MAG: hypothetical protein MK135_17090, partial [Polyangiaceae bacterium]|nr:hypothetical protein [Polyangiaceae bacterium]